MVLPLLSLSIALLLGAVLLWLVGANPWDTYVAMFSGALGGRYAFSETLLKATPIILCALGVSIAFRMLFWNIGAEGQLAMGGFAAAGVALFIPSRYPDLPVWATMALAFARRLACRRIWALIPALLKAFIGVNEIITTLMLNYIAVLWIEYLFYGSWKDPKGYGFPGSAQFVKEMWLGRIERIGLSPRSSSSWRGHHRRLGISLLLALALAAAACGWAWIGGASAMTLGWVAAPSLAQLAIGVTTALTRVGCFPRGRRKLRPWRCCG